MGLVLIITKKHRPFHPGNCVLVSVPDPDGPHESSCFPAGKREGDRRPDE